MLTALRHRLLISVSRRGTTVPGPVRSSSRSQKAVGGDREGQSDGNGNGPARAKGTETRTSRVGNAKRIDAAASVRERGIALLRNPQGMAFTVNERQLLGIHGLLPPAVFTQSQQVQRVLAKLRTLGCDLDRYVYLRGLLDRNEKLFYRMVTENVEEIAPIVYTPTVGLACQKYGFIFKKPRGLYITINDIGHVFEILCNWPEDKVKAIVVTDGQRILGLGDLGAFGMGIPVGKLSLYTAMGGVPPQHCLPVLVDVGTNNENLLNDPLYIGLRHKRVQGEKYDALIDEFLQAVVKRYGQSTLIQFEDFANQNAFRLLEKYRHQYLTFNDDIQGTASVVVAGIIAAMRITKKSLSQNLYLFQGAGEAAIGIADLLVMAMVEEGVSEAEAISKIWMVDLGGLITKNRPGVQPDSHSARYAKSHQHLTNLEEVCRDLRPSVAIGAAAVGGAFTENFLRSMSQFNKRPVVFALSNPTAKAECTAEQAYRFTDGRCVFASGSPFGPVEFNGKTFYTGQGNNSYIFPGVALGIILSRPHHICDGVFLQASRTLAGLVTQKHLDEGRLYPPLSTIREVSTTLATSIVEYNYSNSLATFYPEPRDKRAFVEGFQYLTTYDNLIPLTYEWPDLAS